MLPLVSAAISRRAVLIHVTHKGGNRMAKRPFVHHGLLVVAGATLALVGGVTPVAFAADSGTGPATWYVASATGTDSATCGAAAATACATITQAIANAAAGDTVSVAAGTYSEQVTLTKKLNLQGPGLSAGSSDGFAVVTPPTGDTTPNGIVIPKPAAGSTVTGFKVTGALGEGILAVQTSDVTIKDNLVVGNDVGAADPTSNTYRECQAQGETPGDCGEGLHLMSTTSSQVLNNVVEQNSGGILLTDEMGPTAHNLVMGNAVMDNAYDCGITVAGHSSAAAPNGVPAPDAAGVYDNRIQNNISENNGIEGFGAGVVLAGAGPGTAVYDNLVQDNVIFHNGVGGVTLHDHAPGQYLMGNVIRGNAFDGNDMAGYKDPSTGQPMPGDPATFGANGGGLHQSANVIIFSQVDVETGTIVEGNTFADSYYGIWSYNAPVLGHGNTYADSVTVPVSQTPGPAPTTIAGHQQTHAHTVVLTGTAQANQPVTILGKVYRQRYQVVATTVADGDGVWSVAVAHPRAEKYRAFAYGSRSRVLLVV